ncbi:MAG: gliding motility-associated C-terminal domain-containing protein [Saprospiraceae bacterium]|nr:gliding motility-associated C-terminal domain-containing protein [Saprospiraceae bacterium]
MRKLFFILTYMLAIQAIIGQPANDDCNGPVRLSDITKYCSNIGEFTVVGATPSGYGAATCWSGVAPDVWFSFRAFASDVAFTIIGANPAGNSGGTLPRMMAAIYTGVCGGTLQEVNCGLSNSGVLSMYEAGLIVGRDYLVRVAGMGGSTGTFQICINNFFPPAKAEQDCRNATVLCNNNPFVNQSFSGAGQDRNEANDSCLGEGGGSNSSESQSTWYTWISKTDCNLTFTITPLNPSDDIDFAVYELPNGVHNCSGKIIQRCNATAPPCTGATGSTGLNLTSTDITENFNCNAGEDGFCQFLPMQAGKAYALVINNFSNTGVGFSMDWGNCDFDGPDPNFVVFPTEGLKCDTDFFAVDSTSYSGGIRVREWNFGLDALPQTASGVGPHTVNYYSFGEKFITLTLETNTGCKLTEVRRIDVLPCCEDLPTLRLLIDSVIHVKCFGDKNGKIVFSGQMGSPYIDQETQERFYQFSIDGINYYPIKELAQLAAGPYRIFIQDAKGCETWVNVFIDEPPPVVVDLGPDFNITLGDMVQLTAQVNPTNLYTYTWEGIPQNCTDCQSIDFVPLKDGYVKVTATDLNGCVGIDSVFIKVNKPYPLYFPNVISVNGDNINDFFSSTMDQGLAGFDLVEVYDRWGGRVYKRENIPSGEHFKLWDGKIGAQFALPGVYAWLVKARFIDDVVVDFSGDITVIR